MVITYIKEGNKEVPDIYNEASELKTHLNKNKNKQTNITPKIFSIGDPVEGLYN